MFNSKEKVAFTDYVDKWQNEQTPLKDRILEAGFSAFWKNITTSDLADTGFFVVRTIIPGMQPLDCDHRWRYLGGQRVATIARSRGKPCFSVNNYNSLPHPFP